MANACTSCASTTADNPLAFRPFAGAATGIGWVAMSLGLIYPFEQRSMKLSLINSGDQVLAYAAMGAVIGGWQ